MLLRLTKQPVWLLQLEVRSGLSEAGRSRAVAVAVWIGGAVKTGHGDAANTAGCDRASESRIKVRLWDATPRVNRDAGSEGGAFGLRGRG